MRSRAPRGSAATRRCIAPAAIADAADLIKRAGRFDEFREVGRRALVEEDEKNGAAPQNALHV